MSRRIARILDEPEHLVIKALTELEEKNGFPSHDARFIAENVQKARAKLSDLGLDPDDTTGAELYHALQAKFAKNSRLFELHFAAEDMDFDQKCAKATQLINDNFETPSHWVLKATAAKKVLHQLPPKNVMKYLRYRSLDSMLKREKPAEILLAAKYLESVSWQKAQHRLVSKLNQTDLELRQCSYLCLNYAKWSRIDGPDDYIALNYEIGAIALWPSPILKDSSLLILTLLLSEGLQVKHQKKLSGVLDWWADTDHLVAELGGDHVSLNLKDSAYSSLMAQPYDERALKHGRHNFWQNLLSRYENRPPAEALFDSSLKDSFQDIKLKTPQPIVEFAEEFDG